MAKTSCTLVICLSEVLKFIDQNKQTAGKQDWLALFMSLVDAVL